MQIHFENFEKCYPKRLKRLFRSNINMSTYDQFIPNMQRAIVGNLPPELIHFFPKENRASNIKDFQNILADITRYLRASYHKLKFQPGFCWVDINYRQSSYVKNWIEEANCILNACLKRLSGEGLSASLEYVDRGAWGNVFKFSLFDKNGKKIMKDKALKVYHSPSSLEMRNANKHNNYAEANFWEFLRFWVGHKLDNTRFTRHYISDMKAGFSLTEFSTFGIHPTTSNFDIKKILRIKYLDAERNSPIFGKIYDAGGFVKCEDFIDDKVVLKYFKKLMNRNPKELPQYLARLKALAQDPKTPYRHKIQQAIDLYNQYVRSHQ